MAEGGWSRTPKVLADSSVFKTGAVANRLAPPWSLVKDLHPRPVVYETTALLPELTRPGTDGESRPRNLRVKSPVLCLLSYISMEIWRR